jgi:hypothetical protein
MRARRLRTGDAERDRRQRDGCGNRNECCETPWHGRSVTPDVTSVTNVTPATEATVRRKGGGLFSGPRQATRVSNGSAKLASPVCIRTAFIMAGLALEVANSGLVPVGFPAHATICEIRG